MVGREIITENKKNSRYCKSNTILVVRSEYFIYHGTYKNKYFRRKLVGPNAKLYLFELLVRKRT